MGSRGSVIPFFIEEAKSGILPITDMSMTRFMINLDSAVNLVWQAFDDMVGGEIYVKKIPSMKITDIANAVAPDAKYKIVGVRPGEKLHEQMIGFEDAPFTYEYKDYYKVLPNINNWATDKKRIKFGKLVDPNFIYKSDTNSEWMSVSMLKEWINENYSLINKI